MECKTLSLGGSTHYTIYLHYLLLFFNGSEVNVHILGFYQELGLVDGCFSFPLVWWTSEVKRKGLFNWLTDWRFKSSRGWPCCFWVSEGQHIMVENGNALWGKAADSMPDAKQRRDCPPARAWSQYAKTSRGSTCQEFLLYRENGTKLVSDRCLGDSSNPSGSSGHSWLREFRFV